MADRGTKPNFVARANTRSETDDPSFWVDIGAGWDYDNDDKQGISVRLNAIP